MRLKRQLSHSLWVGVLGVCCLATQAAAESDADMSRKLVQQVEAWQQSAREGDADALFNLGQYFRKGIGIEPDLEQARHFYQQAAERGHAGAQLNLGTLYYFASAEPDLEKVRYWWQQAAEQGEPSAQYQLAILLLKLPEPQPEVSLMWMNRAHAQGYPPASKALTHLKAAYPQLVESRASDSRVTVALPLVRAETELKPEVTLNANPTAAVNLATTADQISPVLEKSELKADMPQSKKTTLPESGAIPTASKAQENPAGETASARGNNAPDEAVTEAPAAIEQIAVNEKVAVNEKPADGEQGATSARGVDWKDAVYTVQLASLTDNASAMTLLQRLQNRHQTELGQKPLRVQPASVSGKQVYRVQAGAFADRAGADRLCARLKQAGQGCFPSRLR